jgi:uncharacterized protein YbbK (DUF523 family)
MILVSACLLGINCRYDGKTVCKPELIARLRHGDLIPVCPEQLGGLATPRPPAEIQGGNGQEVLTGKARVINTRGEDVTPAFIRGAYEVLKIARLAGAEKCFFKGNSPSCGHGQIYDGSFQHRLRPGDGVTAALLKEHGFLVSCYA